jgi:hypothetical protein
MAWPNQRWLTMCSLESFVEETRRDPRLRAELQDGLSARGSGV